MATQLHKPSIWANRLFGEESKPHNNTILNWMKKGHVPVQSIGDTKFIKWDFDTMDVTDIAAEKMLEKIRGKKL